MATILEGMSRGVRRALARGTDAGSEHVKPELTALEKLGVEGVHYGSSDATIEEWTKRLWEDQDDLVAPLEREWQLGMLYNQGEQHLVWHRDAKLWLMKRPTVGRIRSTYNIVAKAVRVRVQRLTENKPTVTVVAATADQYDIQRAEYKQTLWWSLYDKLALHAALTSARRWATYAASGFLRVGWDPEDGPGVPATVKRRVREEIMVPVTDALGMPVFDLLGQPVQRPEQVDLGIQEFYVDKDGRELGPVEEETEDPETGQLVRRRVEPPEGTDYIHEGEAFVAVRSPFNIRFDRYARVIHESWYVQDAHVEPATAILAQFPDAVETLAEAEPATNEDRMLGAPGLSRLTDATNIPSRRAARADQHQGGVFDKEFLVRETFIFPKNRLLKKLWGKKGAYLVTVGGKLVHKSQLPTWACQEFPFIQVRDEEEEGNHYGKPFLRDLIPLQDDVNRTRSMMAEGIALRNRLLLWAPQNHGMSVNVLGGLPAALLTGRSPQHKPELLNLGQVDRAVGEFYQASLAAAGDLANMNDASQGKLPSAGLAAQAIYALQYADEKSIAEVSNAQDDALTRLAKALDAVTRAEYQDTRKVRVTGADRSYIAVTEIRPEHLDTDVDYHIVPGSMLSRNKEAIRNEMVVLRREGVVDEATFRKYFASSVPDIFRRSTDLQEAKARRTLEQLVTVADAASPQVLPFDDPSVQLGVLEEFLLTARYEQLGEPTQQRLLQWWQALKLAELERMVQMGMVPQPGVGGAEGGAGGAGGAGGPIPQTQDPALEVPIGPQLMQQAANEAMEPETPREVTG